MVDLDRFIEDIDREKSLPFSFGYLEGTFINYDMDEVEKVLTDRGEHFIVKGNKVRVVWKDGIHMYYFKVITMIMGLAVIAYMYPGTVKMFLNGDINLVIACFLTLLNFLCLAIGVEEINWCVKTIDKIDSIDTYK